MSEEEKELLNELKLDINILNSNENEIDTHILLSVENIKILLNYISKLEERLEFRVKYCNELEHELYEEGNYIHKEAIRNKIKEVAEECQIYVDTEKFDKEFEKSNYIIKVLNELLERK